MVVVRELNVLTEGQVKAFDERMREDERAASRADRAIALDCADSVND